VVEATLCSGCATELAPGRRDCPVCRTLVHAADLTQLAAEAEAAEARGDAAGALAAWRGALDRLPPGSAQHVTISERVGRLQESLPGADRVAAAGPSWMGGLGVLGVVIALAVTKGKLLLFGLTKLATLGSMLGSLAVYWAAWGWAFALGVVASIYVHEMGHVAALRRAGVPASAPMFVPGLGAFVTHAPLGSARASARVALAGPTWGLAATLAALGAWLATGAPIWAAITTWSARVNLFNLAPIPPLDGGTVWGLLSRRQQWLLVGVVAALAYLTGEGMLWLVLLAAAGRAAIGGATAPEDWRTFVAWALLIGLLAGLSALPVPQPGPVSAAPRPV
jgi:Zn-dependent protease